MATSCDACGAKSSEVKAGGTILKNKIIILINFKNLIKNRRIWKKTYILEYFRKR